MEEKNNCFDQSNKCPPNEQDLCGSWKSLGNVVSEVADLGRTSFRAARKGISTDCFAWGYTAQGQSTDLAFSPDENLEDSCEAEQQKSVLHKSLSKGIRPKGYYFSF